MRYLLDTNICIAYLNGADDGVRDRLLSHSPAELCLCSIVKAELLFGARNSSKVAANLRRLASFFEPLECLPVDDAAAEHYAVLRVQLQREGSPIGANDMLIAAVALANECTLVTRNFREFDRVGGLSVEQW